MVIDSDSVDIVIDSVTLSVKRGTADRPRCSNPSKWRTAFRFLCHCWKNSVNDEKYSVNATSAYTVCVFVCIRSSYIFCCTSLSCAGLRAAVHPCALHKRGLFPSLSNSAQAVPWVLGSSSLSLLSLNHPLLLLMMCFHLSVSSPLTLPPSSPCWFITANYQRWICLWNRNKSKDIFIYFFFFGFVFFFIYLFICYICQLYSARVELWAEGPGEVEQHKMEGFAVSPHTYKHTRMLEQATAWSNSSTWPLLTEALFYRECPWPFRLL